MEGLDADEESEVEEGAERGRLGGALAGEDLGDRPAVRRDEREETGRGEAEAANEVAGREGRQDGPAAARLPEERRVAPEPAEEARRPGEEPLGLRVPAGLVPAEEERGPREPHVDAGDRLEDEVAARAETERLRDRRERVLLPDEPTPVRSPVSPPASP